jgi:Predicted membrane protein (DUF2079)
VFQYNAGIVPFLLAASIVGMSRLKRNPDRLAFTAAGGLACLTLYSPLLTLPADYHALFAAKAQLSAKAHALRLVPSGAPVAASNKLAGYLSARSSVELFPSVHEARWVVIDRVDLTDAANRESYLRAIRAINSNPAWRTVYASHGIEVLRRAFTAAGT